MRSSFFLLALPFALLAAPTSRAAESLDTCTGYITSVPTVISTPGVWCMKSDLATNINFGPAVFIASNNVTLDCNGFRLGGLSAGPATLAQGVAAQDRSNLTIRNCNIRGFYSGISLVFAGGGHLVENNRLDGNTVVGIEVAGDGSVIRGNRVADTGGSTAPSGGYAIGIYAFYNLDVRDNLITGLEALATDQPAIGIGLVQGDDAVVHGNAIRGFLTDGGPGIGVSTLSSGAVISGNVIHARGASSNTGIDCGTVPDAANLRDNTVITAGTPWSTGCTLGPDNWSPLGAP